MQQQSTMSREGVGEQVFKEGGFFARGRDEAMVGIERRRGRGAASNASGRFERLDRHDEDDGWGSLDALAPFKTSIIDEKAKRIITRNSSPDIGFDRSINPYQGCEHGCVYCFARPTHHYYGLSAGLDFETKLFAKPNAAQLLEKELSDKNYQPRTIAIGTNTDPYQPAERERRIMRAILEVLERYGHPVGIVTKSALITRDLDILSRMAERGLVKTALSVTTLDPNLARAMEPRAASPKKRLEAVRLLAAAGVPVSVMVAPVVPALNDHEIEAILMNAASLGACEAGYIVLRLPFAVKDLFRQWLEEHAPDRAARVLSILRDMRGGKDYDAKWGERMRGTGPYAWSIGRRFEIAAKRFGLNKRKYNLRADLFVRPHQSMAQLDLFKDMK